MSNSYKEACKLTELREKEMDTAYTLYQKGQIDESGYKAYEYRYNEARSTEFMMWVDDSGLI